jgi:hypothetical protein
MTLGDRLGRCLVTRFQRRDAQMRLDVRHDRASTNESRQTTLIATTPRGNPDQTVNQSPGVGMTRRSGEEERGFGTGESSGKRIWATGKIETRRCSG